MKSSFLLISCTCVCLAACDPVTMGLVTAGGGVAVNHQMSSTVTRTFSDSSEPVHAALLTALQRMSIEVTQTTHRGDVLVIDAKAGSRHVTLQVEPVTRTSTQLQVAVHQDLLTLDGATGREIVAQTELALGPVTAGSAPSSLASAARGALQPVVAKGATASQSAAGRTTYYGYDHPTATTLAKASKPHPHVTPAAATPAPVTAPGNPPAAGASAAPAGHDAAGAGHVMAQAQRAGSANLAVAAAP